VTSVNASKVATFDATAWDAADGAQVTDVTTCMTDNDTVVACVKVGKDPDDIMRAEYNVDPAGLLAGDTLDLWISTLHNVTDVALLPYIGAGTVSTTNKIVVTASTGAFNTFTLTSAFISDLFDQGGGSFAARFVEDLGISGDFGVNELDADLTGAAVAVFEQRYTHNGFTIATVEKPLPFWRRKVRPQPRPVLAKGLCGCNPRKVA